MIKNGTPATELHGAEWRKSRYSNSKGNCVEFAGLGDGQIGIRDSKNPAGPALVVGGADFAGFVADVKAGALDHLLLPA